MSDTDATPTSTDTTRENWLHRAAHILGAMIHQVSGVEMPEFHVSMGFGGLAYEKGVRGVCWHTSRSSDGRNHVFISPELSDTGVVLAVLLHELIHVALDNEDGHMKRFAEYATRLGMGAPFTTATPDVNLTAELMIIAAELGEFPHAALTVGAPVKSPTLVGPNGEPMPRPTSGPGVQTNRHLAVTCPEHGGSVRISRARYDRGAPLCGIDTITDAGVDTCTLRMVWK